MIILHFDPLPQFKYELFHILHIRRIFSRTSMFKKFFSGPSDLSLVYNKAGPSTGSALPPASDRDHVLGLKNNVLLLLTSCKRPQDAWSDPRSMYTTTWRWKKILSTIWNYTLQLRNCIQWTIFHKIAVSGPLVGRDPLWFRSCKRPPIFRIVGVRLRDIRLNSFWYWWVISFCWYTVTHLHIIGQANIPVVTSQIRWGS